MINFKNVLTLSMVVLLIGGGCEKDESSNQYAVEKGQAVTTFPALEGVTIQDGRLVFESRAHYSEVVSHLINDQELLNQLSIQFPGFISNHQAYEELTYEEVKQNGLASYTDLLYLEEELDRTKSVVPVTYGSLSYFSNEEGMLQLGNQVLKVKYDALDEFDVKELPLYKRGDIGAMETLTTYKIEREILQRNFWNERCDSTYTIRNWRKVLRRTTGIVQVTNYQNVLGGELVVHTRHARRVSGIWWGDKADLTHNGDVFYDQVNLNNPSNVGLMASVNTTAVNYKSWTSLLYQCRGCTLSISRSDVSHNAVDADGGAPCDCIR